MKDGKCTTEDFGKRVQFAASLTEIGVLIGLIPTNNGTSRVVLEKAGGTISSNHCNVSGWHLVETELPENIELLMKKFGCHEPQTRLLVGELLKLIAEKK